MGSIRGFAVNTTTQVTLTINLTTKEVQRVKMVEKLDSEKLFAIK
jgi:hypothetical protein